MSKKNNGKQEIKKVLWDLLRLWLQTDPRLKGLAMHAVGSLERAEEFLYHMVECGDLIIMTTDKEVKGIWTGELP